MDVAQIVTSAVMPGAATIPTSSEPSVGGLAPSPLFSEMFAKATLTADLPGKPSGEGQVKQPSVNPQFPSPGRLLMSGKGAVLSSQVLAMSGQEALQEQGDPDMAGLQEANVGTLLGRALVLRQVKVESARNPEHRGLSLHKGGENKGVVKGAIIEGAQGEEVLPESGSIISTDVSSREKSAEGSKTTDQTQEDPGQKVAVGSEHPVLAALPAGLVSEMVSAPVVQNIPHFPTDGMSDALTKPVLSEAASTAAHTGLTPVRENLLAVQDDGTMRMESRLAVLEGKADLLWKNNAAVSDTKVLDVKDNGTARVEPRPVVVEGNAEVVSDAKGKEVASLVQPKVTGRNEVPAKPVHISSAGAGVASETPLAEGDTKTASLTVPASISTVKETAEAVIGGEKMVGKDHVNVVRHENASARSQVQQDRKVEGKGETVLRELPSGVTVLNPAQTVTTGRSAVTAADAASLSVQASDLGRSALHKGGARDEKGRDISVHGGSEKIIQTKEHFSSQDKSNLSQDSGPNSGNQSFSQASVSTGSFDTVVKGRMDQLSEVPREHEVAALHENILSQVREKLVSQDPSGNVSKITLKLNPHELGELQINVRMENQKMTVDITAHNPVVKEALLQNIDQLKDSLLRQNISMERFNVSSGDGGGQTFNQSFREGRQSAYQTPDTFSYPMSGYFQEDAQVSQVAFGDSKENSLVDMRF
jgi:flagellar hook-length control protein FliK